MHTAPIRKKLFENALQNGRNAGYLSERGRKHFEDRAFQKQWFRANHVFPCRDEFFFKQKIHDCRNF